MIEDLLGRQTFVENYNSSLSGGSDTAGIHLYEYAMDAILFFREDTISAEYSLGGNFQIIHNMMKSALGDAYVGDVVDPLVLDLDGDGLEIVADTSINPHFDMNADGFAERAGWINGGDAFLVQDHNANGKIDDIAEMFGSPGVDGFTELATLDTNSDGVIDASDTAWDTLKLWRDSDFDGVTDAGELITLASQNIASINANPSNTTLNQQNGYAITGTGTFTRVDSSTGTTGNVVYRNNTYDSQWLTTVTTTPEAQALPEVKGHGTLPDLRAAMSHDPSLAAVVDATLSSLSTPDMAVLRDAAMPILTAWAAAVPMASGQPGTQARIDVPILVKTSIEKGTEVLDYAVSRTDTLGTYWVRASGADIKDMNGNDIARPTYADVMAQGPGSGDGWTILSADTISFMERWLGEHLPIGMDTPTSSGARTATTGLISMIWGELNKIVTVIAAQSTEALGDPASRGVHVDAPTYSLFSGGMESANDNQKNMECFTGRNWIKKVA